MRRPVLAALTAACVALCLPAGAAAPKGLHIVDANGDANGLNSQSLGLPLPSVSSNPVTLKSADIVSVDIATVFTKVGATPVPDGTTITMKISGPIMQGIQYGVIAKLSTPCNGTADKTIELTYQDLKAETLKLAICEASTGDSPTIGDVAVDEAKRTITWTLTTDLKRGATISDVSATTSVFLVGVFDEAASTKKYVYGS